MKNTIYIAILVLILSCNKKSENIEIHLSKKESVKLLDTLSKKRNNLNSISKQKPEAVSDTTSAIINDVLEINKQLNGVWNVVEISVNKPDNIINIIYMFDAKKKSLEVYNADELRGQYNYKIVTSDCQNNKNNPDFYYIKLSGDDDFCSEITEIKHKNNKTYLILKDYITESQDKEFLKISDDPKFFPKGFK